MKHTPSKDYHDYLIKDGKFIGAFEEMYRNVDDPWHHGDANNIFYDAALLLLKRHVNLQGGNVLDLGCGKGAFTSRLKESFPKANVVGLDIAPTAIRKANEKYGGQGIRFEVFDIRECLSLAVKIGQDFDLAVVSDVMWYVLPEFEKIIKLLGRIVRKGGWLLVSQTFYPPDKQGYGREIASTVEGMLKLTPYPVVEMIETNRLSNHHAVVLFRI